VKFVQITPPKYAESMRPVFKTLVNVIQIVSIYEVVKVTCHWVEHHHWPEMSWIQWLILLLLA
jgi:hypothetical protein